MNTNRSSTYHDPFLRALPGVQCIKQGSLCSVFTKTSPKIMEAKCQDYINNVEVPVRADVTYIVAMVMVGQLS